MNFRRFRHQMEYIPAFNLNDIRKIDPKFHKRQLADWVKRGYVQSIAGEYYILSGTQITEDRLFMLANMLYEPSYISLESALAYYHIIPETVQGVISVSSRKTKRYESKWGFFDYRSIKPILNFGYQVIKGRDQIKYSIARLEKAVLDYLYLNPHINSIQEFESLRWNKQSLTILDKNQRLQCYRNVFDKKSLDERISILMEYIHA